MLTELVSPNTKFIDPSGALLSRILRWKLKSGCGNDEFFTSGNAASMRGSAKAAFGVEIPSAKHIAPASI